MAVDRERVQLRRLVISKNPNWRLRLGSREGLHNLHANGYLEAEDLTTQEVRLLCAGILGLGQVRQPAR